MLFLWIHSHQELRSLNVTMFSVLLHSGKSDHCCWSCKAQLHFPTLPLVGWSAYTFRSQVAKEAALLQLAHLLTVGESHVIMMLKQLHLHSLILSPNNANGMETSGFAAIRFTVWTNSSSQNHTFNNKQLDINTDSSEEVFI